MLKSEDYKAPNMVFAAKLRGLNIFKMMTTSFLTAKYPEKNASIFDLLNPFNLPNPLSIREFSSCRDLTNSQNKVGFKSRSLEGIGFTAPYLHNGSVPTLDDLLKPAAQRPANFNVGCRHYDLQKMGYDCAANAGHEYGTSLAQLELLLNEY